jgi:hypothetical protein
MAHDITQRAKSGESLTLSKQQADIVATGQATLIVEDRKKVRIRNKGELYT